MLFKNWFVYSLDLTLESVLLLTVSQERPQSPQLRATEQPHDQPRSLWLSEWLVLLTTLARGSRMNAPQLGRFNFLPQCIHGYVH